MLNKSLPRIVVSGLRGGSGKTILSLSLVTLLRKKGINVIPFKKGPDYIDAGWLSKAAGVPCYNLDLFMMTPEQALQSFVTHALTPSPSSPPVKGGENTPLNPLLIEGKVPSPLAGEGQGEGELSTHIAVIEGNRGLYDGMDHKGTYSTAELAKLLKAPVVIIIDCTKVTNTAAAMVLGCQKMDPGVTIGGVVLNRIATNRQESVIRKAINEKCNLPVVGAIPRLKKDPFPERHMGLTPFQEHQGIEEAIAAVQDIGAQYLDMDAILKIANEAATLELRVKSQELSGNSELKTQNSKLKIGVIRDAAFQFYYQENFEELEKRGAELIEVSPLREDKLPEIDALYIGGGFPETHAIALAANGGFRDSLHRAIQGGLPVYAECGGLMYLGRNLILEGRTYPMVGALPISFGLEKRPHAHGYTIVGVDRPNPYFPRGSVFKGHEFHYSKVLELDENGIYFAFHMERGKGIVDNRDGMCYKNVLATYTHLHAIGSPGWADGMVRCALENKTGTKAQRHKGTK